MSGAGSDRPRLLILGSTGRLGPLLRSAFALWSECPVDPVFAARRALPAYPEDPVIDPDHPLPALPQCDAVVALWGVTAHSDEALRLNPALAAHSQEVAQACGARRVFHFSSAGVYGPGVALPETAAPNPQNLYAQAKLAMEDRVAGLKDNLAHCCLRLANVVGADSLAPALAADAPVRLDRFRNGTGPMRSYISASDLARVLVVLGRTEALPARLNIAAPDPVGMADLARAAGKQIVWQPAPATALQTVSLATDRLTALLPPATIRNTTAAEMISDWQRLRAKI